MSALRQGLRVSAITIVTICGLFVVGELFVRGVADEDPRDEGERRGIEASLRAEDTCFAVEGFGKSRRLIERPTPDAGRAPVDYPLARRAGITRIAYVGESNAFILGNRIQSILAATPGGERFEILNCGLPGSGMGPTMRRFREVLDYAPDVVVVIYGHNIHRSSDRADDGIPVWKLKLQRLRSHSRLLTALFRAPEQGGDGSQRRGSEVVLPPPEEDPWVPAGATRTASSDSDATWRRQSRPERHRAIFEKMLQHMVEEAKAKNVSLVLSTMASNRLMAPTTSARELVGETVLRAEFQHDAGKVADALATLALETSGESSAWAEFLDGEWRLEQGDYARAARSFEVAVALDTEIPRAVETQNEFVRGLASREGLLLRDPVRVLTAAAPHGILGWEAFNDCCHYVPSVEASEAAAIFALAEQAAKRDAPLRLAPFDGTRGEDKVSRFFSGALNSLASAPSDDAMRQPLLDLPGGVACWLRISGDAVDARFQAILDQWPSDAPPQRKALALAAVAEGYRRAGRNGRARALLADARRIADLPSLRFQEARWLLQSGDATAAESALVDLTTNSPPLPEATAYLRHLRGTADRRLGRPPER